MDLGARALRKLYTVMAVRTARSGISCILERCSLKICRDEQKKSSEKLPLTAEVEKEEDYPLRIV